MQNTSFQEQAVARQVYSGLLPDEAVAQEHPLDAPRAQRFTLGDWLVDPRSCQVSRGDTIVKLRPQLADLLVCLGRCAGEIVLKDEILAEVWPEQYIAESGLSRCVAELRQILGDDAKQPHYIETITKRGYRLVAPVVWLAREEPDGAVEDVGPQSAEASAAPPAAVHDLGIGEADGAGAGRFWRRGVLAGIAVALLAVGMIAIAMLTRSPAAVLTERDTVLLADVVNSTNDRVFDHTLRLALAMSLEQAPFLHILPEDAVRAAVVRMGRPADTRVTGALALDVCRREGAAVLLTGSIAGIGSRYAVGVEAIGCGAGDTLAGALEQADDKEHVLATLERVATRIRHRLGESRASLSEHGTTLARATTGSLEALKALSLGDDSRDHARLGDALGLYRQAIDLDPEFALAWARRGAAAWNLGFDDEAIPALRRAYELRDRVSQPERFYIEAHYYRLVEGNPQKAIEIYRAWKRMYPGSAIPSTNLASVLSGELGRYDAAVEEAREAVRLARNSSLAHENLIVAYFGSGRMAEARQAVVDAESHGVHDQILHRQLVSLAMFDGDRAALEREVRWATGDPMVAQLTLRRRASAAMACGRLREGRQLWAEALARARELGPATRVADTHLFEGEAEALLGDTRRARSSVEAALATDTHPHTIVTAARVCALVGDFTRAGGLLADLARQPASALRTLQVWQPAAQALVEAGLGHGGSAIASLQPVVPFERGNEFNLVPLGVRARVELSAGRPLVAAAAFDDLIRLRILAPESPWVPHARLGLARALHASGDDARSLAAYDAFLQSWNDADPDAPLLGAVRRERATAARR